MRDRLIELIYGFRECESPNDGRTWTEHLADHLLAEGVIVPPCKVGDVLYLPLNGKILEYRVLSWCVREWGVHITTHSMQTAALHPIRADCIGKTVFLTRAEAEAALAEREGEE